MRRAVSLFAAFSVLLVLGLYLNLGEAATDEPVVEVYLTPTCGCCSVWAEYIEEEGFQVEVHELPNVAPIRTERGVPPFLAGCHTAVVGDYVVEGHVPAEDIRRLLGEQPEALGIAVPGMPIGSPGMEIPGRESEPYEVLLLKEDGNHEVFARH